MDKFDHFNLESSDICDLQEAALSLGVSTQTVRLWMREGRQGVKLPYIRDQRKLYTTYNNLRVFQHLVGERREEAIQAGRR